MQVGYVEAPDASSSGRVVAEVAGVAAYALVAAGAERVGALAREHDRADVEILSGALERLGQLDQRLRAEGVANLRSVDRELRDPGGVAGPQLVADVGVLTGGAPAELAHRAHPSGSGRPRSRPGNGVWASAHTLKRW